MKSRLALYSASGADDRLAALAGFVDFRVVLVPAADSFATDFLAVDFARDRDFGFEPLAEARFAPVVRVAVLRPVARFAARRAPVLLVAMPAGCARSMPLHARLAASAGFLQLRAQMSSTVTAGHQRG